MIENSQCLRALEFLDGKAELRGGLGIPLGMSGVSPGGIIYRAIRSSLKENTEIRSKALQGKH